MNEVLLVICCWRETVRSEGDHGRLITYEVQKDDKVVKAAL